MEREDARVVAEILDGDAVRGDDPLARAGHPGFVLGLDVDFAAAQQPEPVTVAMVGSDAAVVRCDQALVGPEKFGAQARPLVKRRREAAQE